MSRRYTPTRSFRIPSSRSTRPTPELDPAPADRGILPVDLHASLTVLGIDPGLIATGYGLVLAGDSYRATAFGAIWPPPKAPHAERLLCVHEAISDVIQKAQPDEVAVEDFIVGHVRSAVAVGEARAAAVLAASQAGLPVFFYKPLEVKQFVTSYGRGSKEQIALMVQALLGLDEPPHPPDAADALAVALCHCLRRNSPLSAHGSRMPVRGRR